ncbi:hypothetical protein [Rhodococcus sp. NPDC003348]
MAPQTPGTESTNGTPASGGGILFRAAIALFFLGLVAIIAIFVVAATGHTPGLALYLLALLCPLGFLFGIISALMAGRRVRGEDKT